MEHCDPCDFEKFRMIYRNVQLTFAPLFGYILQFFELKRSNLDIFGTIFLGQTQNNEHNTVWCIEINTTVFELCLHLSVSSMQITLFSLLKYINYILKLKIETKERRRKKITNNCYTISLSSLFIYHFSAELLLLLIFM